MTSFTVDLLPWIGALLLGLVGALLLLLSLLRRMARARQGCGRIPPHLRRQPDPCLYSQEFLTSRVPPLPVTWDNPDIWLTELDGTPVGSADLLPDHDYLVVGRIWNASFHPAFGVQVTCHFADWGFSPSVEIPVQVDAGGSQHIETLDIGPWVNSLASFQWHTPSVAGHYCLYVRCSHPEDVTTANNTGQENTRVVEAAVDGSAFANALVANPSKAQGVSVSFTLDGYQIPEGPESFEVASAQRTVARRRMNRSHRIALVQRFFAATGADRFIHQQRHSAETETGWQLLVNGHSPERGIQLGPGEQQMVALELRRMPGAPVQSGTVNVTAWGGDEELIGGVTLRLQSGG